MLRIFLLLSTVLCATGCVHQTSHPGFEPMRPINEVWDMPKVVVVPVFDSSFQCCNWNIASELTDAIRDRILCDKNLFLYNEDETFDRILKTRHIAFEETRDKIWGRFGHSCFVLLVDLFQHDIVPTERESLPPDQRTTTKKDCSSVLMMKARLTILDVRDCTPRILLQEIVNSNQFVPKEYEFSNFSKNPWGCYTWECSEYAGTPCEKAHERLARVIVRRLQNVVWCTD